MKRTNLSRKGLAAGLIFIVLFLCVGMIDLHAGECEKALQRCLEDPYWQAVTFGFIYCAAGYAFCLKYIEG